MQHVISFSNVSTDTAGRSGVALRLRPALIGMALWLAAVLPGSATDYSATIRDLSSYVTNQLQATGASSVALVLVDGNQVVWATGFGLADPLTGQAADADTVYGIASVSKTFTALAAMRWVDQEALNLNAPVTNYVPAFAFLSRFPGAATITPRLLMNHQSGLPGDFLPYAQLTVPDLHYGVDMLESLADEYPVYPPNFSDTYNNNGFTLMESVVAALSGNTFVEQMAADVFQPLGMTITGFQLNTNRFDGKLARSMLGTNAYPDDIVNVHASGGICSSANDMGQVIKMLLGNGEIQGQRYLSTNAIAAMLTFQGTNLAVASSDRDTRNGLGWDNVADPKLAYAGRACFKGGDTSYFHSHLEIMPEHGLGVAVMCNGGSVAEAVAQRALMLALRDKFGTPLPTNAAPFPDSPVTNTPPLPWEQITGFYARQAGLIRVTSSNGYLTLYMNVFDPAATVYTNLAPHVNGWFWNAGNTNGQVAFSNVQDHLLLMSNNNKGQYWNTSLIGERIVPGPVSAAWSNRTLSAWINADLSPFDFDWVINAVKPVDLSGSNGFLFFNNVAFAPTNDSLALPFITGRNDTGALKVVNTNGEEWLRFTGSHYRPIDLLPDLAAPGAIQSTLMGDAIGWYRIARSGSGMLELNMTATPMPQMRVLNSNFNLMANLQPVAGRLLVAPTGAVFVAVTRSMDGGGAYALRAFWRRVAADYDGDGKADPAVYGSAEAIWGVSFSVSGHAKNGSLVRGDPGAIPVAEDYDGDGRTDPAVYRAADGLWTISMSGNGYAAETVRNFGAADAVPVPADYDGDGKADLALWRPAEGLWYIHPSSDLSATQTVSGGATGDVPVSGDYDGDGKADVALFRPSTGRWIVIPSTNPNHPIEQQLGAPGDIPVPKDYDGDGRTDFAVYRPSNGTWYIIPSASPWAVMEIQCGSPGDVPVNKPPAP